MTHLKFPDGTLSRWGGWPSTSAFWKAWQRHGKPLQRRFLCYHVPAVEGLSVGFYQTFWTAMGRNSCAVSKECLGCCLIWLLCQIRWPLIRHTCSQQLLKWFLRWRKKSSHIRMLLTSWNWPGKTRKCSGTQALNGDTHRNTPVLFMTFTLSCRRFGEAIWHNIHFCTKPTILHIIFLNKNLFTLLMHSWQLKYDSDRTSTRQEQ